MGPNNAETAYKSQYGGARKWSCCAGDLGVSGAASVLYVSGECLRWWSTHTHTHTHTRTGDMGSIHSTIVSRLTDARAKLDIGRRRCLDESVGKTPPRTSSKHNLH